MRERIIDELRVSQGKWHSDYYRSGGAYCTSDDYYSERVNGYYSRMVDAGTSKTDEIRTRYLEHHRSETQSFRGTINVTINSLQCGPSTRMISTGDIGPGYTVRGNPWILDASYINQALVDAFSYFVSGCVKQETLLANFAFELPEVRSLWPTFTSWWSHFKTTRQAKRYLSNSRRRVKGAAGQYLAYQFGVAPLIGDLITVWNRLWNLAEHIEWLRKNNGKHVKVEFKKGLPKPTASILPDLPSSAPSGMGFWRNVTELRAGLKAWAIMTYDVGGLSDLLLATKTLLRAFGLNNPFAIAWEAVPYSFVVDWISNVGDLLNRVEIPIELPYVIHDCGYGVFVESVFEDYWSVNGTSCLVRRTRTRGYSRRPGLPINPSALSLETPSAKQMVLGLALGLQKF